MQQIVGHKPELCVIVIYIGYWSAIDSLSRDIESTLELDCEGVNTLMGPNGLFFELIYHIDIVYKGWISFRFTLVQKSVLVIM